MTVFESKPVAGKPLETTLNIALQTLAEKTLAGTKPAAALVAIQPSTGAVLAAANNAGDQGPVVGHRRPGGARIHVQGGQCPGPAPGRVGPDARR